MDEAVEAELSGEGLSSGVGSLGAARKHLQPLAERRWRPAQEELDARSPQEQQVVQGGGAGQHDVEVEPPLLVAGALLSVRARVDARLVDGDSRGQRLPLGSRGREEPLVRQGEARALHRIRLGTPPRKRRFYRLKE